MNVSRKLAAIVAALTFNCSQLAEASDVPAEKSAWVYFWYAGNVANCFASESSALDAELDYFDSATFRCNSTFSAWRGPWPETDGITGSQAITKPALRRMSRSRGASSMKNNVTSTTHTPKIRPVPIRLSRQSMAYCAISSTTAPTATSRTHLRDPDQYLLRVARRRTSTTYPRRHRGCARGTVPLVSVTRSTQRQAGCTSRTPTIEGWAGIR
jgi:hypothetical protein